MEDIEHIKVKVKGCLDSLYENEKELFELDAYEQAICGRLACYLHGKFTEYNVDVEYNRHGNKSKRNEETNLVKPDIVIHKRDDDNNLLVIEAKKGHCGEREKVRGHMEYFGYKLGAVLTFHKDKEPEILWV